MAASFISYAKSCFVRSENHTFTFSGSDRRMEKGRLDCRISVSSSGACRPSKSSPTFMTHYNQSTAAYVPVVDLEFDDENADEIPQPLDNNAHRSRILRLSLALCVAVLCIVLGYDGIVLLKQKIESKSLASTACTSPVIRREWRDLSDAEKSDYVEAVQCLRSSPSRLGLNQTLYDDFPYVHSRNGEACE